MFLKRCLKLSPSANPVSNRFFSFYINFLPNQRKIFIFKVTYCTAAFENHKITSHLQYYKQYMLSKPESYPSFFETSLLEKEAQNNPDSFKLLSNVLKNLKENLSCEEELKEVVTDFSSCDVNEICKKIFFIKNNITLKAINANTKTFLKCIDNELLKKSLSYDETLKILTAVYNSKISLMMYFPIKKVVKFFEHIKCLSSQQVVQLHYAGLGINFSKFDFKYDVLSFLYNNIAQFNIDEIGIISRGLRKYNFVFNHEKFVNAVLTKLVENIGNIHPVPLKSMCELFQRTNTNMLSSCKLLELQEKASHLNFDPSVLLDISDLAIKFRCLHSSFWETMIRKFKEDISYLSPYILLRVVRQMEVLGVKDEEFLTLCVEEFRKYKNDPKVVNTLVDFLSTLTSFRLYPKDLLDLVFSEEFTNERIFSLSKREIHSWWILYWNLKLEKPEYLNCELNEKNRKKIFKIRQSWFWNPKFNASFKLTALINKVLKNLYGENAVKRTAPLPHYEGGLVLSFDKNLKAQPIPKDFYGDKTSFVKKPLDDDHYWIFMKVSEASLCANDKETTSMHCQTELRQLEALGYITVTVQKNLCLHLKRENTLDKFLAELIEKSLGNKIKNIERIQ